MHTIVGIHYSGHRAIFRPVTAKKSTLKLLGEEIRSRRIARGLSQDAVAAKSGLHRNYIGMVERGERNISILSLETITKTLGVSMTEIIAVVEQRQA